MKKKKFIDHNRDKYIATPEFNTFAVGAFNARLAQANLVTETNFDNTDFLVFQPINRYFKVIANTDYVSSWKCKGLSLETIKPPTTSDNSLTPALSYYDTKTRVNLLEVV